MTRLVPQKGLDLIKHTVEYTLQHGGQFVLLGSTPIASINAEFSSLQKKYGDTGHVHFTLHGNEELAHNIFASSDMCIVPSLFEPCGLTQMISLKYGTIPIVRKTEALPTPFSMWTILENRLMKLTAMSLNTRTNWELSLH